MNHDDEVTVQQVVDQYKSVADRCPPSIYMPVIFYGFTLTILAFPIIQAVAYNNESQPNRPIVADRT